MQTFYAHERLLRSRSPFFEAALSKAWKEGQDRMVPLPEDEGAVFHRYVQWMYNGKLVQGTVSESDNDAYDAHSKLYALAEKLLDRELQDRIVDAIILTTRTDRLKKDSKATRYYPSWGSARIIYAACPEGSPGRRLLVDLYTRFGHAKWIEGDVPAEFLQDLAKALFTNRQITTNAADKFKELSVGAPKSYYHAANKETKDDDKSQIQGQLGGGYVKE